MKAFYGHYLAFASIVASPSHDCASISPIGSTNLTPLSHSGLCDAVIITPIVAEKKNVAGLKHTYLVHILGKTLNGLNRIQLDLKRLVDQLPLLTLDLMTARTPIRYMT